MPRRPTQAQTADKQNKINAAAEQIGTALGHIAARIDALHQQREELASELRRYITNAQSMLDSVRGSKGGRPGRPPAARGAGAAAAARGTETEAARRGRPPGFKMSEDAKRKMREAWKRRRKQMKLESKGVGKKSTHSKQPITKPLTERAG